MAKLGSTISDLLLDDVDLLDVSAGANRSVLAAPLRRTPGGNDASQERKSQDKPTKETNDHGGGGGGGGGGDDEEHPGNHGTRPDDDDSWLEEAWDDAGDWFNGAAEDIAEGVGAVGGALLDLANAGIGAIGDAISAGVEQAFEGAALAYELTIGGAVDTMLAGMEQTGGFEPILDLVEAYENGATIHVGAGGESTGFSIAVSEDEFYAEGSVLGVGGHVGAADDGSFSLGLGIDAGPLGHAHAGLDVEEDGDVSISADLEAHVPTLDGGTADLEASGSWEQHDGAYTVAGEVTVGHTTATGQHVGVGVHGSVSDDGHGNHVTELGTHQVFGQHGVGEVRIEETITIRSNDGEITETEGEVVLETDGPKGHHRVEQELWDTGDDGNGKGGQGGNGGQSSQSGQGGKGGRSRDDDADDDVLAPRRQIVSATSSSVLAASAGAALGGADDQDVLDDLPVDDLPADDQHALDDLGLDSAPFDSFPLDGAPFDDTHRALLDHDPTDIAADTGDADFDFDTNG